MTARDIVDLKMLTADAIKEEKRGEATVCGGDLLISCGFIMSKKKIG